ncbi:hypothetical protein PoB_001974900 [Plakobranchus ocellatus]|uniref:Uncharacterized protein n=1 Tax=Plakobranchus ocellatus TaxID=259542 RepID=A0AAV3ZFV4_9GAST|nr:hypothetical protein PoB_001974900 [Plakobranchus ocellatus]
MTFRPLFFPHNLYSSQSISSQWSACFRVVLVLSLSHLSQGFLSDDKTVVLLTPFDLTLTPAHVVRHVTRNVISLCAHQTDDQTQLEEVNKIRMLMKTSSGWGLLAEQKDMTTSLSLYIMCRCLEQSLGTLKIRSYRLPGLSPGRPRLERTDVTL